MEFLKLALTGDLLTLALQVAGAGLMILLSWAANTARQKFGVDINEQAKNTIHSAIMTGLRQALQGSQTHKSAVEQAVEYAMGAGAGDSVKRLGADRPTLVRIATSKLHELTGS